MRKQVFNQAMLEVYVSIVSWMYRTDNSLTWNGGHFSSPFVQNRATFLRYLSSFCFQKWTALCQLLVALWKRNARIHGICLLDLTIPAILFAGQVHLENRELHQAERSVEEAEDHKSLHQVPAIPSGRQGLPSHCVPTWPKPTSNAPLHVPGSHRFQERWRGVVLLREPPAECGEPT